MNKITEILPTDPGKQAAGKSKAVEQQDGPSFHEVLQKITSDGQGQGQQSTETASAVSGASQAAEAASGAGIDPVMSPKQVTGLMRAERTLELLSEYENQLGDGEVSLKDMAGTVDALETEAKELNKILETLDPDDSLFGLLQDVATVAVVESIKFNRGDYLPAATA
jgi:small-conductance mechanosensitive channel